MALSFPETGVRLGVPHSLEMGRCREVPVYPLPGVGRDHGLAKLPPIGVTRLRRLAVWPFAFLRDITPPPAMASDQEPLFPEEPHHVPGRRNEI